MRALRWSPVLFLFAATAVAQSVSGTITIERKLTKRSVTAPVPLYQRGAVVPLAKKPVENTLDFERSRVVVYLEGTNLPASSTASGPFIMEQADREFAPDLLVVPAGATVTFPNMDPIFHNIFSLSKAKSFDLGSYDRGDSRKVTFSKPGVVYVYCHLHPNMAGTIVVTPSRFYARADKAGHYEIGNIPPGEYTLVAWHKAAGFFRKQITVSDEQRTTADFLLPFSAEQPDSTMRHDAGSPGGH
jgi:plastocyanin